MNAVVPTGSNALMPTNMETAFQLAEMMAKWKTAPAHLHNSPGDCLMIVEQAMRWQMSPFAVAQCTSVIQGKLMFEGKLVAAALNASGILASRLEYDFSGEGAQRAVTVRGTLRGETKPRDVTVFLQDAKTSNTLWAKQPDQQLVYASTRVWARRHAPEVMLGVYAPEEFDRAEPFNGQTIDAAPEREPTPEQPAPPQRAAAAATPRAPRVAERAPTGNGSPATRTKEQWVAWLEKLRLGLGVVRTREEVEQIAERGTVGDALATGPTWVRQEISAALAGAYGRFLGDTPIENVPEHAADPADHPDGGPRIGGENLVGAG